MALFKIHNEVIEGVQLLNSRLYNAGYSFKVQLVNEHTVYVQGSFDFGYYVNVHIEFFNLVFTNLLENDCWPDAWHQDQLFLYDANELSDIVKWYDLDWQLNINKEDENNLLAFMFNINGTEINNRGLIVCKAINIRWEHPYYD